MKRYKTMLVVGALLAYATSGWSAEPVTPKFGAVLPNVPGKSLVVVEVTFPPGDKAMPHHHPDSAFLYVYVLSGSVRSQVEGEPARVYRAGQSWSEKPGAHHVVAENVSTTKPARVLAVFVVNSDEKTFVTPDTK